MIDVFIFLVAFLLVFFVPGHIISIIALTGGMAYLIKFVIGLVSNLDKRPPR